MRRATLVLLLLAASCFVLAALSTELRIPVELSLEVLPVDARPCTVIHTCRVQHAHAGQLRPGELLSIRVSEADRFERVVRWGEQATPPEQLRAAGAEGRNP